MDENLSKEHQRIAELVLQFFEPATIRDYDKTIEIQDFINLFAQVEMPKLADIEYVLNYLGFKKEECRIDFDFLVKTKEPID